MLKYSFSEVNQKKSLAVIEFKEKEFLDINLISLKPIRDMRVIKGPIEELIKEENYKGTNREDYIKELENNRLTETIMRSKPKYKCPKCGGGMRQDLSGMGSEVLTCNPPIYRNRYECDSCEFSEWLES